MTIFTPGNDKGSILLSAIVILFCIFIFLLGIIEYEYSHVALLKKDYEFLLYAEQQKELLHETN